MIKRKLFFNSKQKVILQELNKSRIGLTPYDISKRTGVAWVTAKKHIEQLERKNIVQCRKMTGINKTLCRLNFELIYGLPKKKK